MRGKTLQSLASIVERPYEAALEWKTQGGKVIGCLPMYVPEEMVHAAGMLPLTLLGKDEPITVADSYLQPYVCAPVRSNFDMALKGELDFLDGVIFPDICDPLICISDVWRKHKPGFFYHALMIPATANSPSSKRFLVQQFQQLRTALEKFSGRALSDQSLQQSISIYNRNRSLLQRLYALRRAHPEAFSARDIATVVLASMLIPRERHTQLLEQLLKLREKAGTEESGKVKLLVSGNLCEDPHMELLEMVAQVGGAVVDDDLYVGSRYFSPLVNEKAPPLEALAERHLDGIPCPTKHSVPQDWPDYLIDMVKKSGAQGVVILIAKYCDPHLLYYPYLKDRLTEAGIPLLLLETEQGKIPLGPFRTRLQAFVETLKF